MTTRVRRRPASRGRRTVTAMRSILDQTVSTAERLVLPLLLVASVGLILLVVVRGLRWAEMVHGVSDVQHRIDAENEIFRTLSQIFGGSFVLAGLYFSARTLLVSRRAESSTRFSSALESIGTERVEQRIGAINTLGATLRDSSPDYSLVLETLADFIRSATTAEGYADLWGIAPRPDVAAAIRALKRRRRAFGRLSGEREHLDLRGAFLPGSNWTGANLSNAELSSAVLDRSLFSRAILRHIDLAGAGLERAQLTGADLTGARFYKANCTETVFRGARLDHSIFTQATLARASFDDSDLRHINFVGAKLDETSFLDSRLSDCNLASHAVPAFQDAELIRPTHLGVPRGSNG
jgi:uncharacterized protein YjbI with pentapeptide repeats